MVKTLASHFDKYNVLFLQLSGGYSHIIITRAEIYMQNERLNVYIYIYVCVCCVIVYLQVCYNKLGIYKNRHPKC